MTTDNDRDLADDELQQELTEKEKARGNLNCLREEIADLRIGQAHLARILDQLWRQVNREVQPCSAGVDVPSEVTARRQRARAQRSEDIMAAPTPDTLRCGRLSTRKDMSYE